MKKIALFIILLILTTSVVYLNRAYAYIYQEIHNANLKTPEKSQTYTISNNISKTNLVYIAMGDSLTAGAGTENYQQTYPYLIAKNLAQNNSITLKNLSELGYKSIDVKNFFLPQAVASNPNVATLLIGVNDIHNFVSKSEFQKNYEEIIKQLTTKTSAKIYLINIPYIGANTLILPPWNYYFDFKTNQFNKIIKNLATKYNLSYIDLYSPAKEEFNHPTGDLPKGEKSNSYYSKDLFHPSATGYALWANIIYANFNK